MLPFKIPSKAFQVNWGIWESNGKSPRNNGSGSNQSIWGVLALVVSMKVLSWDLMSSGFVTVTWWGDRSKDFLNLPILSRWDLRFLQDFLQEFLFCKKNMFCQWNLESLVWLELYRHETLNFQESNFLGKKRGIAIITVQKPFSYLLMPLDLYIYFLIILRLQKYYAYHELKVTKTLWETVRAGLRSPKSFVEQVSRTWRSQASRICLSWWCIIMVRVFLKITPVKRNIYECKVFNCQYWFFFDLSPDFGRDDLRKTFWTSLTVPSKICFTTMDIGWTCFCQGKLTNRHVDTYILRNSQYWGPRSKRELE